jgi:drug/metabolite transporter (DMT)-like permease
MPEIRREQPLEAKVNPRKWTTKVNAAVVIGVVVVLLIGAAYGIYALLNPREVREDVHKEMTPGP